MFKSPCVCVYARWVSGLEAVAPLLNKGLSYLLHVSKKKRKCENFCFPPVSQLKHVTGSLQPPHGLFWVKGSCMCVCAHYVLLPYSHSLVFVLGQGQLFVRVCTLCAVALFPQPCVCFGSRAAVCACVHIMCCCPIPTALCLSLFLSLSD